MLDTAIKLILTNGDLVFDNFRSTINKILSGDISDQALKEYQLVRAIHKMQLEIYCANKNINMEEQANYDILEMCLFFGDDFNYASARELSNLFLIDTEVKKFSEHHILNDGIWAKLKYRIQITTKLDVMKEALELCE